MSAWWASGEKEKKEKREKKSESGKDGLPLPSAIKYLYNRILSFFSFRDPWGIRPLVLGKRSSPKGDEYCIASEDAAFGPIGFTRVRDINPGEMVIITEDGRLISKQVMAGELHPCIFEYIYLARPDSVINDISVYNFQLALGTRLAQRIK